MPRFAQPQKAKSFELRAVMSLARLWRDQDKVQQARELVATAGLRKGKRRRRWMSWRKLSSQFCESHFNSREHWRLPDRSKDSACLGQMLNREHAFFFVL